MKKTLIFLLSVIITNTLYCQTETDYLSKILDKLSEIKTASYYSKSSSSAPRDTLVFRSFERHVNMYSNPVDTIVGASFSTSSIKNLNEFELCYDGIYSVRFDWENREVEIDTLTKVPYRRPRSPFFLIVKTLINYTLQNIDSTIIKYNYLKDSIKISFTFENKIAEFFWLNPIIKNSEGQNSRYELTVDKNFIPYKLTRKMPYQTSWELCREIKISNELDLTFNALSQIPIDFDEKIKKDEEITYTTTELVGKDVIDWNLKEIFGDSLSLGDLKSKIIMIQFTGIGCGPCHSAIPFLKQLVVDNKGKDFEFISIETWSKNISGIKRYIDKNELNYKVLVSDDKVKADYKIDGVPTFFIIDEKREINKVYNGYQEGFTDKEIIRTINKLR